MICTMEEHTSHTKEGTGIKIPGEKLCFWTLETIECHQGKLRCLATSTPGFFRQFFAPL